MDLNNLLWSSAGFLVGTLVGHRLGLDRDRRSEFNKIADQIRPILQSQLADIRAPLYAVSDTTAHLLIDIKYPWQRAKLRAALAEYSQAHHQHVVQDVYGAPSYTRTDHIERASIELITQLKRW